MLKKFVLVWSLLWTVTVSISSMAADGEHTIYLFRHAEKITGLTDGGLTGQGKQRAENIAQMLKNVAAEHVYSTDFIRTQQTAAPLAKILNLPIESYNPRLLADFSQRLKSANGVSVVAGHSNTTPNLVKLLGGEPGSAIGENEYSRLYQVTLSGAGEVKTVLLHSNSK